MRICLFWLSLLVLLTVTIACSPDQKDAIEVGHDWEAEIDFPDKCVKNTFEIVSLPYAELTSVSYSEKIIKDKSGPVDGYGVTMTEFEGRLYYHPVDMCHRAFHIIAAYRETGDSTHLSLARLYVDRLINESVEFDSAIYYPYAMDYRVHNMERAPLKAPWYSGMAQGEILGLMVRMFWATGDSVYIEYARKTFKSFLRPRGEFEPWTVFVDSAGCYWIEEYPTENPSMTLNGFIYGLYGVYDYYLLTGEEKVKKVLIDCLSTLKNYIPLFRRPGHYSFYDLQYRHWSERYHQVHIRQFRQLYKMTGDEFFKEWADIFEQDHVR